MTGTMPEPDRYPVVQAHLTLGVLAKLGVFIVATVVVIAAIGRAQQLIGLVILAGVLCAALSPVIERLRRFITFVPATLLTHALAFAIIVGTTTLVVQQISAESASLEMFATEQLAELDDEIAPNTFSRAGLSRRTADATARWGTTALLGDDQASGIALRASQLLVIIVLSIFFTLQGHRLVDAAVTKVADRETRRTIRTMWSAGVDAGATQLRHTVVHGIIAGAVTAGVSFAFGLPGIALLAVWAACLSAVPVLGPLVGWAPVIVVGAFELEAERLVLLVVIAGAALLVLGRVRASAAPPFPVGPLIITLGIAAGTNAAGLPGAAAGLMIATGTAHAVANHRWRMDDVDRTALAPVDTMSSVIRSAEPGRAGVFVEFSTETMSRIAALVLLAVMIQLSIARTSTILVWAAVGLLLAVGLDRPVSWIHSRTGVHRSAVVIGGGVGVLLFLVWLAGVSRGSASTVTVIDDDLSEFAASVEDFPVLGSHLADLEIEQSIDDFRRRAPQALDRSPLVGRAARLAGGGAVAIFWIAATTMTALIDGRRVAGAIDRRVPARYTRQVSRLAEAVRGALAGYVAGSALVATLNGALVAAVAALSGVPMPAVFAVWAFAWNFVPQVGAILGWAPVLMLAIVVNPAVGLLVLAFFVVYQVIENNLIQPTIIGHAVDISALAALGAALAGTAIAGLVGGVLAIPIVGVVHAIRTELAREDFPRT